MGRTKVKRVQALHFHRNGRGAFVHISFFYFFLKKNVTNNIFICLFIIYRTREIIRERERVSIIQFETLYTIIYERKKQIVLNSKKREKHKHAEFFKFLGVPPVNTFKSKFFVFCCIIVINQTAKYTKSQRLSARHILLQQINSKIQILV